MERRLLMRPGRQCPRRASVGRFQRRRLMACVAVIQLPPGWMTVIWMSVMVVAAVGAVFVRRVHEAAELLRAVSLRLGELAQPDIPPLT